LEEYQGKDPMDCCHSFFCSCCWSWPVMNQYFFVTTTESKL
jgi:hypothetical protein